VTSTASVGMNVALVWVFSWVWRRAQANKVKRRHLGAVIDKSVITRARHTTR
jgi:hypothetical protein